MAIIMSPTVDQVRARIREVIAIGSGLDIENVSPAWGNLGREVDLHAIVDYQSGFGDENPEWSLAKSEIEGELVLTASAVMVEWYNIHFYRDGATNTAEQTRMWLRSQVGRNQVLIRGLEIYQIGPTYDTSDIVLEFSEERCTFSLAITFIRTLREDEVQAMQAANVQVHFEEANYIFTGPWNDTDLLGYRTYTSLPTLPSLTDASLSWETDPVSVPGMLPVEGDMTLDPTAVSDLYIAVRLARNIQSFGSGFYTDLSDFRLQLINTNSPAVRLINEIGDFDLQTLLILTEGDFDQDTVDDDYLYWLRSLATSVAAQTITQPQRRIFDIQSEAN